MTENLTPEQIRHLVQTNQVHVGTVAKAKAKRGKGKKKQADHEKAFENFLRAHGVGGWVREHKGWHPTRGCRFDFAWIEQKFAIEIDGGVFSGGRHVRPSGVRSDYEKLLTAAMLGWIVVRMTPEQICTPDAIRTVRYWVGDGGKMPPEQTRDLVDEIPEF